MESAQGADILRRAGESDIHFSGLQQTQYLVAATGYDLDIRPGFVKTPLIEGSNFPMQLDARKVAVSIVDGIERRKPVITINWLYRLLVFFWQMIPRSIWIKMKVK